MVEATKSIPLDNDEHQNILNYFVLKKRKIEQFFFTKAVSQKEYSKFQIRKEIQ